MQKFIYFLFVSVGALLSYAIYFKTVLDGKNQRWKVVSTALKSLSAVSYNSFK